MRAIARRLVVTTMILLAGCSDSDSDSGPTIDERLIPQEVRDNAADWPLPGRDYANSRSTTSSTIDSTTIARLELAWEVPTTPGFSPYGTISTTPLIAGDTVYFEDLGSNIRAIDRATGTVRWEQAYNSFAVGPNGVAIGWGKLFAIRGTKEVVALDLATGEELWAQRVVRSATDGIDIQPTVIGELVLVSTVPISINGIYAGGDHGVIQALDQATGELVWEFDTVDSDDIWGNPEVNSGGGSWYPPAIDLERERVYWGIANPAPFPGTPAFPNGSSRPGPNLYTDSVVALDIRTGELDWYRQAIEHDLFDRDLVHTMLVDVVAGGENRRVAIGTGKLARVIGQDADSGEVLWDTPVGIHRNDDLTSIDEPTEIFPGTFGGVLTPPAAAGGVVYVATLNAPSIVRPDAPAYFGGAIGTMPGQVVAIDAANGAILWDVEIDGDPTGGTTVVNDLVLTATFQGAIVALDRNTGAEVWRYTAPGGINSWPAVAGDLIVWPVGTANPPRLLALRLAAE